MKIIITENRRNNVVTKWLDDEYGELQKYISPGSYRFIHYKNNNRETIFTYNRNTGVVYFEDKNLQNDLIHMFGLNDYEINDILIPWFEERYNLHVDEIRYIESPYKFY